jgi:RNA polymerase sigma-70 factor (ECF subfamily)
LLDDDAAIMQQVQAGRTERFAELVRRHQSAMVRYARSRLGVAGSAEDAVQETFLAAFRGRHTFDAGRGLKPWLWTILANTCSRLVKTTARNDAKESALRVARQFGASADVEPELRDERERLARLLKRLPAEQSEAVRLRFFSDLSYEEIGSVQSCSTATAKSRVRYGLAKLSEWIHADPLRLS